MLYGVIGRRCCKVSGIIWGVEMRVEGFEVQKLEAYVSRKLSD